MRAQSLVEYGLLIAVLALVVLAGAANFGYLLQRWFDGIIHTVTST